MNEETQGQVAFTVTVNGEKVSKHLTKIEQAYRDYIAAGKYLNKLLDAKLTVKSGMKYRRASFTMNFQKRKRNETPQNN